MRAEVGGCRKEVNDALRFFDKKMSETEAETLWRIKDVEKAMEDRISE
jgi:hypothetical protein